MMNRIALILAVITLLWACGARETSTLNEPSTSSDRYTINQAKLDSLLSTLQENDKFMGSIALSYKDSIIYANAVGFDDVANRKVSTTDTKYRMGSVSKMFTAALIFKAVEEGKLTLKQTIARYFPAIENADKITISHLLHHRSGIHDYTDDAAFSSYRTTYKSPGEMVEIISVYPSDFEPASKAAYSNSNYILLSAILENIYQAGFKAIVEEKICLPLQLRNTYYGGDINLQKNESYSYAYDTAWTRQTATDLSVALGAGAMVSTPADLTRFMEALFSGRIVGGESLDMMTAIEENFGRGILSFTYRNKKGFGHNGSIDGFKAVTIYFPEEHLAIALTSNGLNYSMNNVINGVLDCYFNQPFTVPDFREVEITAGDLKKYVGVYSSPELPGKMIISQEENTLYAQIEGLQNDPLVYKGNHQFTIEEIGADFIFNPEASQFSLKQGEAETTFTKE